MKNGSIEQSVKINQDEKNEEIEIMTRDIEQAEISPIHPKDLNGLTGELVMKTMILYEKKSH